MFIVFKISFYGYFDLFYKILLKCNLFLLLLYNFTISYDHLDCLYFNEERLSGENWSSDTCTKCHCSNGVVSCQPVECDCTKRNINFDCCPHCDHSSVCKHQESPKTFRNGDQWVYQCQTCECLVSRKYILLILYT